MDDRDFYGRGGRFAPGKARRDEPAPSSAGRRAGVAAGKTVRTAALPSYAEPPPPKLATGASLSAAAAAAAATAAAATAAAAAARAAAAKRSGSAEESRSPGKRSGEAEEGDGPKRTEPKRSGEAEEGDGPKRTEPKRSGEAAEGERIEAPKRAGEAQDVAVDPVEAPVLDFAELDEAFENAATSQGELVGRRAVGVREVLGNLNEADAPSLADELLKTLAVAALGYASGYITAAVTEKLAPQAAQALATAVQSGLDDGLKDAATKIAGALAAAPPQASKSSFFAGQEDGLESLRASSLRRLSAEKRLAKESISSAANAQQEPMLAEILAAVRAFAAALGDSADRGRQLQYQASLSRWLSALAQSELGQVPEGGAELGGEVDAHPDEHYREEGVEGVVYIAFGSHPAELPLLSHPRLKVSGMTEATRQRIADVPLRELGLPVVATGYVYDGFLDGTVVDDNEVGFGRNEARSIWVEGDEDGLTALGKAGHFTDPRDTVEQVLRDEVDALTLAKADL
jgi:hypothetical protein